MNPFNPDCIARGFLPESHSSDDAVEETKCCNPRIYVAVTPKSVVKVHAIGSIADLSAFLKCIATALVQRNLSSFALMLAAQQAKDKSQFEFETNWALGYAGTAAIFAQFEYHGSVPGISVGTVGVSDDWSHLIIVLIHVLIEGGLSFDTILDCLQAGARRAAEM